MPGWPDHQRTRLGAARLGHSGWQATARWATTRVGRWIRRRHRAARVVDVRTPPSPPEGRQRGAVTSGRPSHCRHTKLGRPGRDSRAARAVDGLYASLAAGTDLSSHTPTQRTGLRPAGSSCTPRLFLERTFHLCGLDLVGKVVCFKLNEPTASAEQAHTTRWQ